MRVTLNDTRHFMVKEALNSLIKYPTSPLLSMLKCIDAVKTWMTVNRLELNGDKTEVMAVSSGTD